MPAGRAVLLAAALATLGAGTVTLPLWFAEPEGRLVFNISVQVDGESFSTSASRLDLGSKIGLMLPSEKCRIKKNRIQGCAQNTCAHPGCSCAQASLLMPASTCPDGSLPSGRHPAKNGRSYAECPASDVVVRVGDNVNSTQLTLGSQSLGKVLYLVEVTGSGDLCEESEPAKTGFRGIDAPFLKAMYEATKLQAFSFSIENMEVVFGPAALGLLREPPRPASTGGTAATSVVTPFRSSSSGGRIVQIIAVNGVPVVTPVSAAIDSGNPSFLSYGPNLASMDGADAPPAESARDRMLAPAPDPDFPLEAATKFPFNVTFEGGGTLHFPDAPVVNGKKTHAMPYMHNVLALGFLAPWQVVFDDGNQLIHFVAPQME